LSSAAALFPLDVEIHHELTALYLKNYNISKASAVFEEVLLLSPHSVYNLVTYAEIQYTLGQMGLAFK
jgi:hypothetical protein